MNSEKTSFEYAMEYHTWGWNVIPVGPDERPPTGFQWKRYQTDPVTLQDLETWFGGAQYTNLAVLQGRISQGLACRDFDIPASYDSWAEEYSELAAILPTSKTPRGYHVYFNAPAEDFVKFGDGELRGRSNVYTLLPPSVGCSGPYKWLVYPTGDFPLIDPYAAGLAHQYLDGIDQFRETDNVGGDVESLDASRDNFRCLNEDVDAGISKDVSEAISRTVPHQYGTRHAQIFQFARHLCSMPAYTDADPKAFRSVVREWHHQALPNIRTKEFEETWIDFLKGWPKIRHKIGDQPIQKVFRRAVESDLPSVALQQYPDNQRMQFLVALCRALQEDAGDEPFFLACRTVAGLFDVTPMTASRWLFLLESDKIIETVSKGTFAISRRATRFRYVARAQVSVANENQQDQWRSSIMLSQETPRRYVGNLITTHKCEEVKS